MSHNQSRAGRTESTQYRKSGRSNYHRNFSGGGSKGNTGSGGGATAHPPSSSSTSTSTFNTNNNNNQPALSSNRSFKKHTNVQGGQGRAIAPSTRALNPDSNAHPAARTVLNGPQPPQQPNVGVSRDPYSSSGRIVDRPRLDRRGSGLGEEEKWNKVPGPLMTGRAMRMDMNYGHNMVMLRPTQVPNHGVLRNPRLQPPLTYPGHMFPGQMQSLVPQVGVPRNSPDSERWQRGTAFQTSLQVMHEEETKQRQLKAILNKLMPQNFEKLFEQVKQVNIDNVVTLAGLISQIFDKALMEPTFCETYANFCHHLAAELPDLSFDNEKITFKRLLLNKCQEEFERGEREQEEANKADVKGEANLSAEEREEKRRRMLGNIRLIGELYKKKMLTERIMHDCIKKLLGQYQNPNEEDVEALCKLMRTIGEMIDHPKAKGHMDTYFDMMDKLSNNMKLSSRVRFMLKDAIDLRKNKWQQRRKVEGSKKIEEVHRDATCWKQLQQMP